MFLSTGVWSYVRGFFWCNFGASQSIAAIRICRWEWFGFSVFGDTKQEQGRQANPPAGSASEASKQEQQQARPACSLLRGSEVTLGSFLAQFWSFSVPHCYGDLPLGAVRFLGALAVLDTVQEQGRMFFFTGFGNYVKEIFGAIWELLRPSLPWGFAAGTGSVFWAVAVLDTVHEQGQR